MTDAERLDNRLTRGGATSCLAVFLWMLACTPVSAGTPVAVTGIRFFTSPDHTRVVLDLSGPAAFEVRRVGDPDRLAINVPGAVFAAAVGVAPAGAGGLPDGLVQGIRKSEDRQRAQVVLDLAWAADYRSFSLKAMAGKCDRIVLDVLRNSAPGAAAVTAVASPEPAGQPLSLPVPALAPEAVPEPPVPFTVIIDPGHGGTDPGAVRAGLVEKDLVLDIAREVARLINALPGYRAVLTRTGDVGLELSQRVAIARREKGDLFLSIHGNSHPAAEVGGMEVYFLSLQKASDSQAAELADRENAALLVGLAPDQDQNSLVLDILMDLKAGQILHDSSRVAHDILAAGRASGLVAGRAVKQAGFHVLRNLAMPSALIEVAYLSHARDVQVLQDRQGRRDLAAAIVDGVVAWRSDQPAQLQLAAGRPMVWAGDYRVQRGDSLWDLARRYGTTVTEISLHNGLHSGTLHVGQNLQLPVLDQEP